jgi:putative sugar O-methyltransferase
MRGNFKRVFSLDKKIEPLPSSWQGEVISRAVTLDRTYHDLNLHPRELGVWTEKHTRELDVTNFRSDNVYVWQKRDLAIENYLVSYLVAKIMDKSALLESLSENGSYGVEFYEFCGRKISRDLIDSVLEINFLIDLIGIDSLTKFRVLDIGAGYGRLAKNLAKVFPAMKIGCVDAIPMSTAISEFYLHEEIERGQIEVFNLTQLDSMPSKTFDLAVNIHSFSEMSLGSVENWISFLMEAKVERVFVVPNPKELRLNNGEDFLKVFERFGYKVTTIRAKYLDGIPENSLLYPANYFYLELV